jgi:dephospho-CoA kinase
VLLVGLTGGIGSGKSTVAEMLADRGAVIVDADELARDALDPGTPGLSSVVDAFGPGVLQPDGSLDRAGLASLVFADERARRTLESIVHPEVARRFAEEVDRRRGTDAVVVYVVPLLVENQLEGMFDVIVVVTAEREARIARLAASRSMTRDDIVGRMDAQGSDRDREQVAHVVITNDGTIAELRGKVDDLWARLQSSAGTGANR